MKLDREIQLEILTELAEIYPFSASKELRQKLKDLCPDIDSFLANICYLQEHGLLIGGYKIVSDGGYTELKEFKLTKDGHDFLLKDGGIGAILNVVTIKFHDDVINSLIEIIQSSSAKTEDKKKLLSQLRSLPADATKHTVMKIFDQALAQVPNAVQWLGTALSNVS
ncbi:hypothetical protein B4902_08490 [Yersinia frederiksenii]|uniref:hypothetical protein n=1 Tax=Yersinia frederiksenii TaxID=29484 RepID=UPI000B48C94F|nr:hypothetical protein [Yersinia frederiksenii]OWF73307.1 hypothetical protein B4902_08490 [Yersinia frederiksenii]